MYQSTIFQLCGMLSWVEPVISKDEVSLAQGHNTAPRVRIEPATLRSRDRSYRCSLNTNYRNDPKFARQIGLGKQCLLFHLHHFDKIP